MISLALRLILHQPLRYFVALLGISVAAGLSLIQLGLYRGFKENASVIVDNTPGDLWVCAEHHKNFDFPKVLGREPLDKVRATPGVRWASELIILFRSWKTPDGNETTVQVVGFDPESGVGAPWSMVEGLPRDLRRPGNVTVDTATSRKLAHAEPGTEATLAGITVRVAGVTDGIRCFQGNPVVFTNLETARSIGPLGRDQCHYLVVAVQPGVAPGEVQDRLRGIEHVEVHTKTEFSHMAQDYWLRSTGAGAALGMAALLGLIVGVVVAGQVLYTSTVEHIKEYGTLKAIGATNLQVSAAILAQAVSWAIPAHLLAGGLLLAASRVIGGVGIYPSMDARTYAWLGLLTLCVCVVASLLSVFRVLRVQPADVFKA